MDRERVARSPWKFLVCLIVFTLLFGAGQPSHGGELPFAEFLEELGLVQGFTSPAHPAAPIVWTELGPSGLIARAITTEATCPVLRLDGLPRGMQERAAPSPPRFSHPRVRGDRARLDAFRLDRSTALAAVQAESRADGGHR